VIIWVRAELADDPEEADRRAEELECELSEVLQGN
jgi:hypothetical protein